MYGLVLYRSHYGNTKRVAEELSTELEKSGVAVELRDLRRSLPSLDGVDFVFIGCPTRMARPGRAARTALRELARRRFYGRPVGVFDTYGPVSDDPETRLKSKHWLEPGAAGLLSMQAAELGLTLYPRVLRCEMSAYKGPLREGEVEKAREHAREFRAAMVRAAPGKPSR
jgi:flavodoxin